MSHFFEKGSFFQDGLYSRSIVYCRYIIKTFLFVNHHSPLFIFFWISPWNFVFFSVALSTASLNFWFFWRSNRDNQKSSSSLFHNSCTFSSFFKKFSISWVSIILFLFVSMFSSIPISFSRFLMFKCFLKSRLIFVLLRFRRLLLSFLIFLLVGLMLF